jgi:hypothetical protein
MSIHISCYTKYSPYELQGKLNNLSEKYSDLFPLHYYLSSAVVPHPIQKEISNEFGLDPCSYFIMSVNNKALEMSTDVIANVIRNELGKENVIMLLNGEDLI